jgi:hypothetical protein
VRFLTSNFFVLDKLFDYISVSIRSTQSLVDFNGVLVSQSKFDNFWKQALLICLFIFGYAYLEH